MLGTKVRFIQNLSPETQRLLERIYQESKRTQVRARAHCILLSFSGFRREQLIDIFGVSRRTIHYWFQKWETQKLVGLYDRAGRGRKPKLSSSQKEQVKEWVKSEPKT
ncbi:MULTISPECIES: helix-turn-helix domain-containing protein [Planktothricoides]|uniref:Helix-turn-helix domain-containing protein n=2 Tax=Planktothricoides raciborskii TaxID=132608 RepID=A0AAU8JCW6_9CYAN|nr:MULTISPECIES: helix-turn-helix domain-containing protein [Planktothricoides]MBD2542355.1 helix-turn-helix domain-containing protein [Planktothricoides raciborskii FACHB-1370]MBD2582023.1 helix-turn-helix domain-containing protein [Planktothricoides raciborskii FACHB-1261]